MFSLKILTIVSLVHFSLQEDDDLVSAVFPQQFKEECLTESHMDRSLMEHPDYAAIATDRNSKCFVRCMMIKTSVITESNEILIEKIREALNVDESHDAIRNAKQCQRIDLGDVCETAYAIHKCITT